VVSTDQGGSWKRTKFDGIVYAQDPNDPQVLYLDAESGLSRSDDGGETFVSIQAGISKRVESVAVDPFDSRTIYAGVDAGCMTMCLPPGGVYKSVDKGAHWTHLSFPDVDVPFLDVDPFQEGVVYANGSRSDDAGATWEELGSPGPIPFVVRSVPSLLYGFSFDYAGNSTVLASNDRGRTWVPRGGPLPYAQVLASDPVDSNVILVGTYQSGIFRSTDGGQSWKPTDFESGQVVSIAFDPCDSARVYASGADREGREFFVSRDAGAHFTRLGVFPAQVSDVAVDPGTPSVVYAEDRFGHFFRSDDAGQHWSAGLEMPLSGLVVDAASRVFGASGSRVAFSDDRGQTWSYSTISSDPYFAVTSIASGGGDDVIAGSNQGIWLSADAGIHWESSLEADVDLLTSSGGDHPVVYASLSGTPVNPVLRSADEGDSWQSCGPMPVWTVSALAAAPGKADVVYVAGAGESGDTWLFRSADGCGGFLALPWSGQVSSIAVSPIDSSRICLAGNRTGCGSEAVCGNGVWMSRDAGETWSALVRPASDCEVTRVSATPDDLMLHAASACGEIDIDLVPLRVAPAPPSSAPVVGGRRN
jgi:photosystem II stability/assembly factor-like uncharacterized protein